MKIQLIKIYSIMTLMVFLLGTFYVTIVFGLNELKDNVCITMCSEESPENNESESKTNTSTNNILEEEIKHKECTNPYYMNDYLNGIVLHLIDRENLDHQHHIPSVPTPPPDFC